MEATGYPAIKGIIPGPYIKNYFYTIAILKHWI